jgi:putative ABC transport system permease protein
MIHPAAKEWGTLKESFAMAIAAIRASKLRSILTLLGIVVGVFSIISVMTAVGALKQNIESALSQLGANTFQVQKFTIDFNSTPEQRRKMWNRKNITVDQALLVKEKVTLAEAVGMESEDNGKIVFWEGKKTNPNVSLSGITAEVLITADLTIESGRAISQDDIDMGRKVIVLGSAVREILFPPNINPVGQTVRIDKAVYQIIGVFAKKGSLLGSNQDNFSVIPISVFMQLYGRDSHSVNITVKALNQAVVDDAIEQTRAVLRVARRVPPGSEDDFGIFTNDSLVKQFNDFTLYVRMGVFFISCIALIAAGVGIMNIMLVSVTERTREIGIRKAIGARRRDILFQFMLEAVILSQIGGVVGVLLGIGAGNVVGMIAKADAVFPWDWAIAGLVICSLVGFVFGVYPAWKASTLDPIEALRYE